MHSKRHAFSNYLSPLKALPSQKTPQRQRRSSLQLPQTRSNQRREVSFSHLASLDEYKLSHNIKIRPKHMEKINYSLSIEETSQKAYQLRVKQNQLYLNYNRNPFMPHEEQSIDSGSNINIKINHSQQKNGKSITEEMKKNNNYEQKLRNMRKESVALSQQQIIKRRSISSHQLFKKKQIIQSLEKDQSEKPMRQLKTSMQFDDIISIKESNFFAQQVSNQQINIFRVKYSDQCPQYSFGFHRNIIKRYYLCHDSILTKANSQKTINIFMELSNVARMLAQGQSDKIPAAYKVIGDDLNIKMDDINARDLLKLASGQIESFAVLSFLNRDKDLDIFSQRDEEFRLDNQVQNILYRANALHKGNNFELTDFEMTEAEDFRTQLYTLLEENQHRISVNLVNRLKKVLEAENEAIQKRIKDKSTQVITSAAKKDIPIQILEGNHNKSTSSHGQIDRKIRMSKIHKDRIERIKVNALIEAQQSKQTHDRGIKYQNKRNSKERVNSQSVSRNGLIPLQKMEGH